MTATAPVWMLDTNILSHAIRYPRGPLAVRIQQLSANLAAIERAIDEVVYDLFGSFYHSL